MPETSKLSTIGKLLIYPLIVFIFCGIFAACKENEIFEEDAVSSSLAGWASSTGSAGSASGGSSDSASGSEESAGSVSGGSSDSASGSEESAGSVSGGSSDSASGSEDSVGSVSGTVPVITDLAFEGADFNKGGVGGAITQPV
ncbi:MAG: hypothetical protein LBC99_10160, partial [Spirochaetota bacterium]|nr:hypothetical protein [Spirochaetota bacterium]